MSEFFKALEQAEKDRRNAEAIEPRVAPARATDGLVAEVASPPAKEADVRKAPEKPVDRPPVSAAPPKLVRRRVERPRPSALAPGRTSVGEPPRLVAYVDPKSVAAEAYRALRANLEFLPGERACRNVVVTSASVGEGKSTTAANLAVTAAQSGWRVCLVDADLRRPVLHRVFDVANKGGLVAALAQELPLSAVAVPTAVPNLSVVVAGTEETLPRADLITASRLQHVLSSAARDWDLVLYDTPPVIAVADTIHLVAQCDGVILVVKSGAIPMSVLRRAERQIQQVRGRVLGVLLNRVDLKSRDDDSYGYYRAYYNGRSAPR